MKSFIDWWGVELSPVRKTEKVVSFLGGFLAIVVLLFSVTRMCHLPLSSGLVASMGASAVLLFAVPHGQLSQPWPVLAGHTLSAAIGVTCAKWIPWPELAAGGAVGCSIGVMYHFKCIHPPGGATALVAALGGPVIEPMGYGFVFFPVMANALSMVVIAFAFNYAFSWRRYPASLNHPESAAIDVGDSDVPSHEAIVEVIQSMDSFVDISEDDLVHLIQQFHQRSRQSSFPVGQGEVTEFSFKKKSFNGR